MGQIKMLNNNKRKAKAIKGIFEVKIAILNRGYYIFAFQTTAYVILYCLGL